MISLPKQLAWKDGTPSDQDSAESLNCRKSRELNPRIRATYLTTVAFSFFVTINNSGGAKGPPRMIALVNVLREKLAKLSTFDVQLGSGGREEGGRNLK